MKSVCPNPDHPHQTRHEDDVARIALYGIAFQLALSGSRCLAADLSGRGVSDGRDLLATACAAAIPLQVGDRAMGRRSDRVASLRGRSCLQSERDQERSRLRADAFVAFFAWTRDEKRLRLSCVAVLAGFAVFSGSALLGANFRKGEWPSDVYYGGVGSVSNYLVGPVLTLTVALFTRRHSSKWPALFGLVFVAVALVSAQRALWPALGLQAALVCVWLWQVRAVAVGPVRLVLTGTILLALIGAGIYVSEQYRAGGNPDSPLAMGKDLRPRVWKKIGEEILAHPLSGAGFGLGVMSKAYPALLSAEGEVFISGFRARWPRRFPACHGEFRRSI